LNFNTTVTNTGNNNTGTLVYLASGSATPVIKENPVPGYYKNAGTEGYIKCKVNGCTAHSYDTLSGCTVGKLSESEGLVIGCGVDNENPSAVYVNFKTVPVAGRSTTTVVEKTYVSDYSADSAFGFDASAAYYVLKIDTNSITVNIDDDERIDVTLDKSDNSLFASRKEDFCSTNSSGYYLSCKNGKCIRRKQDNYEEIVPNSGVCNIDEEESNCKKGYYLKSGETKACKISTEGGNCVESFDKKGYYWNESQYNEIIECNGSTCKKAEIVVTDSCLGKAGRFIDNGYMVYFCTEGGKKLLVSEFDSEFSKDENKKVGTKKATGNNTGSDTEVEEKTYVIKGQTGSIFDNIDAYYAIKKEGNDNSIIVNDVITSVTVTEGKKSCEKGVCLINQCSVTVTPGTATIESTCNAYHCNSTDYDGYRFIDNVGKDIKDNTLSGFYVKIEGGECGVISQYTKPGVYFNQIDSDSGLLRNKYPLIECTVDDCKLKVNPATDSKTYYYLNQEEDKVKPIIECNNNEGCDKKVAEKTYYHNGERNMIECSKSENKEISCISKLQNGNAYYPVKPLLNESLIEIIKCDGDSCTDAGSEIIKNVAETNPFVVLNGLNSKEIIKCESRNVEECKVVVGNDSVNSSDNKIYYIDSSVDKKTLSLIECAPMGANCQSVKGINRYAYVTLDRKIIICYSDFCKYSNIGDDYYLNGGGGNPLIIKDSDGKKGYKFEVGTVNKLYKNANKGNTEYGIILCTSNLQCSEIVTDTEKLYINYIDYKILNSNGDILNSNGDDTSDTNLSSNVGEGDKKVYLVNPETFEILNDNTVSGRLVECTGVKKTEGEVTKVVTECKVLSNSEMLSYYVNGYIYSDSNYKLIQYKNSVLSLVEPGIGYYINNSGDFIECNSSLCEKGNSINNDVLLDDGKCRSGKIGKMSETGKICIKEGESPVALTGNTVKYLLIGAGNNVLGLNENSNYIFDVDNKKVVLVKIDYDRYYYFKDSRLVNNKNEKDGVLYKCLKNDDSCIKEEKQALGTYYYPNGDSTISATLPKIKCEVTEVNKKFICNLQEYNSSDIYCTGNNKLYQCTTDKCPTDFSKETNCYKMTPKKGYYLSEVDNTQLILCDIINNELECQKTDISEGYYVSQDPAKPLIKCVKSFDKIRCLYESANNGYYIKNRNVGNKLVKCDNNLCTEEESVKEGWYVSSDGVLIYCNGNIENGYCEKYLRPNEGYYVNGSGNNPNGKYLVECSSRKDNRGDIYYTCVETGINNKGYYVNSGVSINGKTLGLPLIDCSNGRNCNETDLSEDVYYLNGKNRKLIYCIYGKCREVVPTSSHTTWFKTVNGGLIGCKSNECSLYTEPSKSGYYMNGDTNTLSPLLEYKVDKFEKTDDSLEKGWYRNGDVNASNSEMVIRCNSANNCYYVEAQNKKCEENKGGFSIYQGYLEWCNTDGNGFKLEGTEKIIIALFRRNDVIPGVSILEGLGNEQYALVNISQDRVISTELDGYYYHPSYGLYECPIRNRGICTKVVDIVNGYYYESKKNKIYECENNNCEDKTINCNNAIVSGGNNKFNLCDGGSPKPLNDISIERLYALNVKEEGFPGATSDYILAKVSKYAVKFVEDIDTKCTEKSGNLSNSVEKLSENKNQVSSTCVNEDIVYDYDTNDGYFIYDNSKNLKEVYIPKISENKVYKLHCEIGGLCIEKKMSEKPIESYKLENGILMAKKKGNKEVEVVSEVKEGSYIMQKGSDYVRILCKITGACKEKEIKTNTGSGVFVEGGKIKFNIPGITVPIVASTRHSKFVLQKKIKTNSTPGKRNLLIRDDDTEEEFENDTVLELTHVSYTSSKMTRNIFVDDEYSIIETEDKSILTGYVCKNGQCTEITKSGNKKYYINTIQNGKDINAYVVCGGDADKCKMISLSPGSKIIVPNGAYNGVEDALISCESGSGCKVVAASSEGGLPDCKLKSDGSVYDIGDKLYNKDNDEELLDGQYCLHNGEPKTFDTSAESDDKVKSVGVGLHMFNVALEEVGINDDTEDYINASLYYCIEKGGSNSLKCSRTYGYLTSPNGYSKCTRTGCQYVQDIGSCKLTGAGTMVSNNEMCLSMKDNSKIKGDFQVEKYYPISIDVDKNFPEALMSSKLIVSVKDEYKYVLIEDGYILIKDNEIKKTNEAVSSESLLYKCTSENMNCIEIEKPDYGYYKNIFGKPIVCNNKGCGVVNNMVSNLEFSKIEEIGYEPVSVSNNFPGYNSGVIAEISKEKIVALKVDDYILLKDGKIAEDFPERTSELYLCSSSIGKCEKVNDDEEGVKDGWYISYKKNGNAIYCENELCYSKELIKACSGSGDLIFKSNKYYICNKKTEYSKSIDEMIGKVEQLTGTVTYFGGKDYISFGKGNVIAIGNSKDIEKDSTSSDVYVKLGECKTTICSGLNDGQYCIRTNKLYKCIEKEDTETQSKIISPEPQEGIVLLYGNRGYPKESERKDGAQMYNCIKDGICSLVTGYLGDIKCDNNGCGKAKKSSSENGSLNPIGGLNIGLSSPVVGGTEEKYYYISGNNEFPGAEGKESILVQSGKKENDSYFIIFRGEGYYLISEANKIIKTEDSNAGNRNKLYLCSGEDLVCKEQTYAESGYYKNAASEKGNAIILCSYDGVNGSKCKIADTSSSEVLEINSCNENSIGRIVRDRNKNPKFCYTRTQSEPFTSSAATVKYLFVNLTHGNKFANVDLKTDTEKNKNDEAVLLVKITNQSITQVRIDGYIIYNNYNIIENVNTKGTLYLCENRIYEYEGTESTYQCSVVKEVKSGWYFNNYFGDQRYIRCKESQCTVVEAPEIALCEESGSLIYNNGKLKVCVTKNKQIEVEGQSGNEIMMNVSKSTEFPGLNDDNSNIIVKLDKSEIVIERIKGYVVVKEDDGNRIISLPFNARDASEAGELYTCESTGSCNKIQFTKDNWYLYNGGNTVANQLIKCVNKKCSIYNPSVGFYISGKVKMPIIQCIQQGDKNEQGVVEIVAGVNDKLICKEREFVEGWFINAESNGLIKCTTEFGCIKENEVGNGWYVNAGASYGYDKLTDIPIYPIIKCRTSVDCVLYDGEIGTSCSKGGEVVYVNKSYKICKSGSPKDYKDFNTGNIEVVEISNYDDFPVADKGLILVSVNKEQVVQLKEDGYYYKSPFMYKCASSTCVAITDNGSDKLVVLNEITKTLFEATCIDDSCTWSELNTEGYYFVWNNNGKNVIFNYEENKTFTNLDIYYCRRSDLKKSDSLSCEQVTESEGFMYNPYHSEGGKVTNTLYSKNESGYSIVKPDDGNNGIRKCSEYKTNYCYISYEDEPYVEDESKGIYDTNTDLPVEIKAGDICTNNGVKLYFAIKDIDTGIDNRNCVPIPSSSDNSVSYYRINEFTQNEKVYLVDKFGARVAEEKQVSNEVVCTYDIKTGICKTTGSVTVNAGESCRSLGGYLYLAKERINSSSGGNCVKYESDNNDILPDVTKVERDKSKQYYIVNDGLYMINENKVDKVKEGVYVVDSVNYGVSMEDEYAMDISEDSQYKLYICNKEGCTHKTHCEVENGYEYILDKQNEKVIKCDPLTNTITKITTAGYYLNGPWKNLIKCYNDKKCLEISSEEGMEGYYIDKGNMDKMIVCIRNGDKFSCGEENIIECNYNENNGKCSSNSDLLRNSYCFFRKEDKAKGRIEKLLYVENFIKSGSEGKCVVGGGTDVFVKYRTSEFLGHEERDELIRINKDSIVSVYEKDIGYYIVDTKEGKGLVQEGYIPLKKTRFYVCRKNVCNEGIPINQKIYINKASNKKLVKYNVTIFPPNSGNWNVIDNGCVIDKNNEEICNFSSSDKIIDSNRIIYRDHHDSITLYDNLSIIKGKARLINHEELIRKTFIVYDNLYLFDEDGQSFTMQSGGPFVFNLPKNVGHKFNLTPYMSTRKETDIKYYNFPENSLGEEGYYINKADIDGLGIVIQKMKIPQKLTPPETTDDDENGTVSKRSEKVPKIVAKYKAIINKCTSKIKNICVNTEEGSVINEGGVCVVTEGEFKGLYLAIETIKKTSQTINCVKYEEGGSYKYLGKDILFAGMNFKNTLIEVNKDEIVPFKHDYENDGGYERGYYVLEETESKNLIKFKSDSFKTASAYKCEKDIEIDENGQENDVGYSCSAFNEENGYYYTKPGKDVMEYRSRKWRNETAIGYYFFNSDYLPSKITVDDDGVESIDDVEYKKSLGGVKFDYSGRYLNSASKGILVDYDKNMKEFSLNKDLKICTVDSKDGSCNNESKDLESNDACYGQDGKLYVVNVIESEEEEVDDKVMCYSGSPDKLKYALVEKSLYMLDGMSVKSMGIGYYILNENMEEFSSKYPEVPNIIIYCREEDDCEQLNTQLELEQDVIVNEAISNINDSENILRYYAGEDGNERFMNVKKNGYYCLNQLGSIPEIEIESTPVSTSNCWTKLESSSIIKGNGCSGGDICINSAKRSEDIVIENGTSRKYRKISIDYEKEVITVNQLQNLDNSKDIFVMFNSKLYKLKKEKLEHVSEGLYLLMNDGKPFTSTEPTEISEKNICYYVGGRCSKDGLVSYRKHKYVINRAANSIVTYQENNGWRTINEDGYYFFFAIGNEQPYSVNLEDRRIYNNEAEIKVRRIVDGKVIEINDYNNGIYLTEGENEKLVIERVGNEWYDAKNVVENVEAASRRRCKAIEVDENIEVDEYCYSDKYGICMPRSTITEKTVNEGNCIFSSDNKNYYYLVNGSLYIVNDYSYQRINNDGIYVIDNENLPYSSWKENESSTYLCENGKCGNVKELKSMYYLNTAALELGETVILYYNENSNSWKKVDKNGNYFFNKLGFGVSADDEVKYYYTVKNNGNEIEENKLMLIQNGTKILSKSKEEDIYVSKIDEKIIAKSIMKCTTDGSGVVKSNSKLNVGDICISENNLVIIRKVKSTGKHEEVDEYVYEGVETNSEEKKYVYVDEALLIVDGESVVSMSGNGTVIIDNKTMLPLESVVETEAALYNCTGEKCLLVDTTNLSAGKYYINNDSKFPLVKYVGNNKWKVENEVGYYFFDSKINAVSVDVNTDVIYEITNNKGVLIQKSIVEDKFVGFYLNKAFNRRDIVLNNNKYWSPGQKLNGCSATVVVDGNEEGIVCKSSNSNSDGYDAGDYCYESSTKQLYFLIDSVTNTSSTANCVFGSNDNPKYIYYNRRGGILNGVNLSNVLIEMDGESVKLAKNGYYMIDGKGNLVNEIQPPTEDGKEQDLNIYNCNENGCSEVNKNVISMIQTNNGEIYEVNEDEILVKVSKDGLYFFDVDGNICSEDKDEVGSIIRISNNGAKQENVLLDELDEGAYVNEGDIEYAGVYEEGKWSIVNINCEYDITEAVCRNDKIELDIGSYCISEGKMYIITSIDENDGKKCIPGSEAKPIYFTNENKELIVVKEKSVNNVNEEGYYAINEATFEALVSEEPVKSKFVQCEYGGVCTEVDPEVGRYANRSPEEINIVKFDTGSVNETVTVDSKCTVEGSICSSVNVNATLAVGDVCINEASIYIINSDSGSCIKAEKTIVSYQVINQKMYMLTNDAVIQKFDGYYFINGNNRAIMKKSDYSKADTVGYMCSNKGDCYLLPLTESMKVTYYPDYTTKSSKKYNVVKYDPGLKSGNRKRQEEGEGSSGYESVSEPGIYKLDDGSYTECEMDDDDEIKCHDLEEEGSFKTVDDELVTCVENDEGEVECSQATEGGYYEIDGVLMECEANLDGSKLECEEVDKEGYFLSKPDDTLYMCSERQEEEQAEVPEDEEVNINKILEKLNGNNGESDSEDDDDKTSTTETTTETSTESSTTTTTTEESTTSTTTYDEYTPTPIVVDCKPVTCEVGQNIYNKNSNGEDNLNELMYECKSTPENGNKFESSCDSGNYVKGINGFYECENDKSGLDEDKIEKPNEEHTSKTETPPETTTQTEPTSSSSTSSSTTTTTTTSSSSSSSSSSTTTEGTTTTTTSAPPDSTTKPPASSTTSATTTTTPKATTTTTTAGASSMFRLPSITFYLILFIISYYLFI